MRQTFTLAPIGRPMSTHSTGVSGKENRFNTRWWQNSETKGHLSPRSQSFAIFSTPLLSHYPLPLSSDVLSIFPKQFSQKYRVRSRGIGVRFLKLSLASAFSPIMTKFSQYTPQSTCYSVLVSICQQD